MNWIDHTSIEQRTAHRLRRDEPLVDVVAREEFDRGRRVAVIPEPVRTVSGHIRVTRSAYERIREADPYTDPERWIWVKGIWRKVRHWLVPLVLVGIACGGLAALVILLAGGPRPPHSVTLAPSPAKFCGRAGVRVWFFDGQNESVACFDGRAFQWSR